MPGAIGLDERQESAYRALVSVGASRRAGPGASAGAR